MVGLLLVHYCEHRPRPELRHIVRCFWELRGMGQPETPERVIPDGCTEIVLNRAAPFRRFAADGSSHRQSHVLLVGQLQSAIEIAPQGAVDLLGVRFQPAGLHALLGTPMHTLADVDTDLGQVAKGLHDSLSAAAFEHEGAARIAAVERALLAELHAGNRRRRASLAGFVADELERGVPSIGSIADSLQVGRRRLERAFRREIGLSPQHFARIRRIQSVVRRLEQGAPPRGWAFLAVDTGYCDQSHLIREFRALAGTTPGRYAEEQNSLNELFAAEVSHPSNP